MCVGLVSVYHICRLMGRTASHITLEVALQCHPNVTLIGEECAKLSKGLREIIKDLADVVCQRSLLGRNYGVFILPEGLIDFVPDVSKLLHELNEVILDGWVLIYSILQRSLLIVKRLSYFVAGYRWKQQCPTGQFAAPFGRRGACLLRCVAPCHCATIVARP